MANTLPDDIPALTQPAAQRLNQRQQLDYSNYRKTMLLWLLHLGKDPDHATGYSKSTVKRDAYRLNQFYRWVWEQEDRYTTSITHDHADAYVDYLATRTGTLHSGDAAASPLPATLFQRQLYLTNNLFRKSVINKT